MSEPVDQELGLYAYAVATHGGPSAGRASPSAATFSAETLAPSPTDSQATGARGEILDAIAAITTRSGRSTFTVLDVVAEMRRRGTRYAESTIQTMVSSHMCAQSMGPGSDPHKDLERVGRGLYRRRSSRR